MKLLSKVPSFKDRAYQLHRCIDHHDEIEYSSEIHLRDRDLREDTDGIRPSLVVLWKLFAISRQRPYPGKCSSYFMLYRGRSRGPHFGAILRLEYLATLEVSAEKAVAKFLICKLS